MADAVLEIVTNPTADDSKDLETDSDAVLCKAPALVRYAQKMLARRGVLWFCQFLGVAFASWRIGRRLTGVDNKGDGPLATISTVCSASSFSLMGLTMFSLRRVTREDVGQLTELGVGRVMISVRAATHLQRWGFALAAMTCGPILGGGLFNSILWQAVLGNPSSGNPSHIGLTELSPEMRLSSLMLGVFGLSMVPFVFGWWLALKTASVMVSDAVRFPHRRWGVCSQRIPKATHELLDA